MRVIAGSHKGRRLLVGKGTALRPTSGRVKEALFSILSPSLPGARFLDLFAGTGAIGVEALSRGAAQVTFVESDPSAVRLLKANLDRCGFHQSVRIECITAARFLQMAGSARVSFDIIFADPPYDETAHVLPLLAAMAPITPDGVVVLEHQTKLCVPESFGSLRVRRAYRYGDTSLTVFEVYPGPAP